MQSILAIGLGGIRDTGGYDPTEPGQSLGQPALAVPYAAGLMLVVGAMTEVPQVTSEESS